MQPGQVSELLTAADGLQYLVFVPSTWTTSAKDVPLLLFLHGRGGVKNEANVRGISLIRMLIGSGPPGLVPKEMPASFAEGFNHIVVAPVAAQPGWDAQFDSILALLDKLVPELGADPKRITLAGQSMGGNGAWMLAAKAPERFAAVVPVCGFAVRDSTVPASFVEALSSKPIWAFHSVDDSVVKVENTDGIIDALKAGGAQEPRLKYTRYETAPPCVTKAGELAGHGSYELAFATPELYSWMLEQRLE